MADWVTCRGCQLRHSPRPTGLCPRCKQPVDQAPAAPAEAEPAAVAPSVPDASAASPSAARLGRLAQSARGNELKSARGIMLFVGVLSLLLNGYFLATARANVEEAIKQEIDKLGPGFVVDQAKLDALTLQAIRTTRLIAFGGAFLGVVFIGCGMLVQTYPVPVTITALALYLGGTAVFGFINPASLLSGFIVKIFIVVGLFRAVSAAIAYQKEQATTATA